MSAPLSRHQRILMDLALRILRAAMARSGTERVDTIEVRIALRCLLHHCPERWPLLSFWDSAGAVPGNERLIFTTSSSFGTV